MMIKTPLKCSCSEYNSPHCKLICSECGWNPIVGEKRLKKNYTKEQIEIMKKTPLEKFFRIVEEDNEQG